MTTAAAKGCTMPPVPYNPSNRVPLPRGAHVLTLGCNNFFKDRSIRSCRSALDRSCSSASGDGAHILLQVSCNAVRGLPYKGSFWAKGTWKGPKWLHFVFLQPNVH